MELKKKKIRCMALCPYWVKTEFFDVANNNENKIINNFDVVYEPEFIVEKAYKAITKKKPRDVCIPGKFAKAQTRLVKILPHSLVMKIWLKKQKIK